MVMGLGRRSRNPVQSAVWWVKKQSPKVKGLLAVLASIFALVLLKFIINDHDNLFVAAEFIHGVGIAVLIYKLMKEKTCAGEFNTSIFLWLCNHVLLYTLNPNSLAPLWYHIETRIIHMCFKSFLLFLFFNNFSFGFWPTFSNYKCLTVEIHMMLRDGHHLISLTYFQLCAKPLLTSDTFLVLLKPCMIVCTMKLIGKELTHKRKSLHVTIHAKSDPDMNRVDCMLFNIRYDLNIRN
jgi:hypothetical protein